MAQWVNRLQNKIFVNPPSLSLLCEISGILHLAQLGLTAGRLAGWQMKYKIFKVGCRLKYVFELSLHLTKVQHHYSLTNAFQPVFSGKAYCKVDFKVRNFPEAIRFPTNPYY